MSGSKKISELTTATVLDGSELIPIVQQGETRQVDASLLGAFAPVLQVNGQTGLVVLALADLSGETIVRNEIVSATFTSVNAAHTSVVDAVTSINTVITSVNAAHTSVVDAITSINAAHTSVVNAITSINTVVDSVSVLTSVNAASITSVQAYLVGLLTYDIGFDFAEVTVPASARASIVLVRNCTIPADFSGSRGGVLAAPTSAARFSILHSRTTVANTSTIGTAVVSTNASVAFESAVSGTPITLLIGDRLSMRAPASSSPSMLGATFTVAATRTI